MAAAEGKTNRIFYYLSLIGFFGIFSTTISKNPVLPLFAGALGAGGPLIGVIAALSPLAGILFSFPVGVMTDRLGQKKLLVVSAFFFLFPPLLYLFVHNPVWLIPIRFVHGLATAILGPLAAAAICGAYASDKGEKLGTYSSMTLVARTLAPLLGGFVISWFAYLGGTLNYRLVYAAAFVLGIPVFVFALLFKEHGERSPRAGCMTVPGFFAELAAFGANRRLLSASFVEMATYFSYGVLETYLPLYLAGRGVPAGGIGLIFSLQVLAIALTKPFFGRVADRVDKRTQILLGILVLGLSAGVLPFLPSYAAVLTVSLLFGAGMSLSTIATSTYVAEVARRENLGASMGALSSIMDIGHSFGPLATGFLIAAVSLPFGFVFSAGIAVFAALFFTVSVFPNAKPPLPPGMDKL